MSLTVPPWLRTKDQAFSLFFSKVVTDTKEDDQTLQPFATAIFTELQERADSKMWRRFLNKPWTITTFTEQQWQWLFICHPLFHINLLHLVRDKEHGLLNLGTEKHRDRSFHPLTQGGGWKSMVQKANSALEKHKRTPATCITPRQSSDPFLQTLDDLSIILFEQHAHSNVAINISLVVIYIGLCKHRILSFPNHFQEFFRETHSQVFCRVMPKGILNKLLQHLEPHYNTQKWLQSSPCMPASPSHSLYCFKTLSTFFFQKTVSPVSEFTYRRVPKALRPPLQTSHTYTHTHTVVNLENKVDRIIELKQLMGQGKLAP